MFTNFYLFSPIWCRSKPATSAGMNLSSNKGLGKKRDIFYNCHITNSSLKRTSIPYHVLFVFILIIIAPNSITTHRLCTQVLCLLTLPVALHRRGDGGDDPGEIWNGSTESRWHCSDLTMIMSVLRPVLLESKQLVQSHLIMDSQAP